MKLLIELQALLEGFDPRRLLLHVQQLLTDEYPNAEVELDSTNASSYSLEFKYADLRPITLHIYQRDEDVTWTIAIDSKSGSLHPADLDEKKTSALDIYNSIDVLIRSEFASLAVFEDDCDQLLTGAAEDWVLKEVDKLFKYLVSGRLKKASDVHVTVLKVLDDRGLQELETRYNSTLVNHKKLQVRRQIHDPLGQHPSDASLTPMEIYILAALE